MNFAYILSKEAGVVNKLLSDLAKQLLDDGVGVVGTTQIDTPRPKSQKCDMDVCVLPDGDIIRISQDLGPNSRGCHLDPHALEQAAALTAVRLDGAQVLIINKFGKHEAEGRGFRNVIAEAVMRDIPVVVGTNGLNIDAFLAFTAGEAHQVEADMVSLTKWAQQCLS